MKLQTVVLAALSAAAIPAQAYCIHNDLKDRDVKVVGELTKGSLMQTLRPGEKFCCTPKDTECNPEGKITSNIDFEITVLGKPEYVCGIGNRKRALVKLTGAGIARVVNNPKAKSELPYVVRVRSQDRDVSGPAGLSCNEAKGN